jgi:hypothetical protein
VGVGAAAPRVRGGPQQARGCPGSGPTSTAHWPRPTPLWPSWRPRPHPGRMVVEPLTIFYGSGSDFRKVMVPVPVPTSEKLWFRFQILEKLKFRFQLWKSYGSGSGTNFRKVMIPVPVPTSEKLWFRFRFLLLKSSGSGSSFISRP